VLHFDDTPAGHYRASETGPAEIRAIGFVFCSVRGMDAPAWLGGGLLESF